ncbi:MAG: DUF2956 domain-containing protein [Candidatus Thiodiazotropha sp. (ex Monitilora ramsayi)]|nr:DUF2956 domain-containing protein [Candidatus Thiodiazotropha sp. (ex Monitilora ramsayi)]
MARNNKRERPSDETIAEAMRIAKSNQRPGQTKEQTKLIAQGIQKGIDQYKKQQKMKARERDKRRKKEISGDTSMLHHGNQKEITASRDTQRKHSLLPWVLLAVSWAAFSGYILLFDH